MRAIIPVLLVLGIALVLGCIGQPPGPGAVTTGKVYFTVTDKPLDMANVTSVLVTIDKIEVHERGMEQVQCRLSLCDCKCHPEGQTPEELNGTLCGINCRSEFNVTGCKVENGACGEAMVGEPEENATEEETGGAWVTVIDEPQTFDLLTLTGVEQLVGELDLESGQYNLIRLYISETKITMDGEEKTAKLPSGKIDINIAFTVTANSSHLISLDFNVNESLHITGNGTIIMAPVIKTEFSRNVELQIRNKIVTRVRAERQAETEVGMDESGAVGEGKRIDRNANLSIDSSGRIQARVDAAGSERECRENYDITATVSGLNPRTLTVCQGSTVTWTFRGNVEHRLYSESGGFDSGVMLGDTQWSYTFERFGTFHYRDIINRAAEGFITVEPAI